MDKSSTSSPIFTTNPAFKSESFVKMKRFYEQVIKTKILRTDDIYRSYDIKKMRVIKAVRYDI